MQSIEPDMSKVSAQMRIKVNKELKSTSERIGQLYPILIDHYGEVIDGEHRLSVNKKWRKAKLKHVRTEKDRLVARIICNNVRRTVPEREKRMLLNMLGEIFLKEGVAPGKIAYKIAEETGMSYRWVAKYLATKFKDRLQSERARLAERHAAMVLDEIQSLRARVEKRKRLVVKHYSNTNFVSVLIEKSFYKEFEKDCMKVGFPTDLSIMKALEDYQKKMRKLELCAHTP